MTAPRVPVPATSFRRYFRAQCPGGRPEWIVTTTHTENEADADLVEPITVPGARCPDGVSARRWSRSTEVDYLADVQR